MIVCPICNTENVHLEIICKSCGCFLQQKVENINLFEVLWLLLENPKRGLRLVALAKHKNYIFFISILIGISYTFKILEMIKIYDFINKPLFIFIGGLTLGIPIGFILLLTLTYLTTLLSKIFKLTRVKFKQIYSTFAFAGAPIIYILIFVFPIKIMVFGIHVFSENPSALIINSSVYWITEALTYIFILYFLILFTISISVLFELKIIKTLILSFFLISFITVSYLIFVNIFINHLFHG